MHKTTKRFWKLYNKLPHSVQKLSKENFKLLKDNHHHPSLQLKKIGKFWSIRIGLFYRALAIEDKNDYIWICTHDEYDKMIK